MKFGASNGMGGTNHWDEYGAIGAIEEEETRKGGRGAAGVHG